MKKDIAMKWVEALRSGKYKQTRGTLKNNEGFCCLGVLCEINGIDMTVQSEAYPKIKYDLGLNDDLGLSKDRYFSLSSLNDHGIENLERLTFDEIADIIQIFYKEL